MTGLVKKDELMMSFWGENRFHSVFVFFVVADIIVLIFIIDIV